jgi:hypothetical protein
MMTMLEQERGVATEPSEERRERDRLVWLVGALIVLGLAAALMMQSGTATPGVGATEPRPTEQETTERLVNEGYLPPEVLGREDASSRSEAATDDLVNRGLIPRTDGSVTPR